jgi:hypothetical protein
MQRPMTGRWPVRSPGEGQLAVNALQVLEVLADDSNFRRMAMRAVAGPAAAMLTMPASDFESAWCAGARPYPPYCYLLQLRTPLALLLCCHSCLALH